MDEGLGDGLTLGDAVGLGDGLGVGLTLGDALGLGDGDGRAETIWMVPHAIGRDS